MGRLSLSFLGSFEVVLDQEEVKGFDSDKVRALLVYLAVESDRPHRRERLAGLLWGDRPERAARQNLRRALSNLRQVIGDREADPPFLSVSPQTVQFSRASDHWLDVGALTELVAVCEEHEHVALEACNECVERLQEAIAIYRGIFLEGFSVAGASEFEEWALLERERLQVMAMRALRRLAGAHERTGDYERAIDCARRQLELDAWREEAHRQLMRALALSGRRGEAVAQYEACRRVLTEEVGVEPALETVALYERIRDGELLAPVSVSGEPIVPPLVTDAEWPVEAERPLFVGREEELGRLGAALEAVLAGQGAVAFVTGEAGSGKTALMGEFARRAQVSSAELVVAQGSCNAYGGVGDPYHPFREILAQLTGDIEAGGLSGGMGREQAGRLWDTLPVAAQALLEVGRDLIETFVSGRGLIERASACAPPGADWIARLGEVVRRRVVLATRAGGVRQASLFGQYTKVMQAVSREVPLLLVLDDLQWADGGSASLLFHLGRQLAGSRILVLGAFRPEEVALGRGGERHPLEALMSELRRRFGDLEVDLDRTRGREFVWTLVDSEPNRLGAGFRETLYRQTLGHALFTVELLHGMRERGNLVQDEDGCWVEGKALEWGRLPARVEAAIAQRIGRLPRELRDALAVASVEGEAFTAEVVARVRGISEAEIVDCLSGELARRHRLVVSQGTRAVDSQRVSAYRFRHILYQRYLYATLDDVERAYLHRGVAMALEALYGEQAEEVAVQLARHFEEAGVLDKAVGYLHLAGTRAIRMSAGEEAVSHLSRGLELVGRLPEGSERAQFEVGLQMALGSVLSIVRGVGYRAMGEAYRRARELCEKEGLTDRLLVVLRELSRFHTWRGEAQTARELAEECLELARAVGDAGLQVEAHLGLGMALTFLGELTLALEHLEEGISRYDPRQHQLHPSYYAGPDPGVLCVGWSANVLSNLGYPDQALKRMRDALAMAQELAHPWDEVRTVEACAVIHMRRGEPQAAREMAEAAMALAREHGFTEYVAFAGRVRGWALIEEGQEVEGLAQICESLASYRSEEGQVMRLDLLTLLAKAYGKVGQPHDGLAVLAEALATRRRMGTAFRKSTELPRVKGELLAMMGEAKEEEAEACLRQAIAVARRQSAKSLELRAAVSLSRLLQRQGRIKEARELLAETYSWFTEGFETSDLVEAKALLKELSD